MDIIDEKFQQWVSSENNKERKISIFNIIKELLYKIEPGTDHSKEAMTKLLREKTGSCEAKHFLLGYMYEKIDLEVKYCTYEFLWKEIKCDLPAKLKALAKDLLPEYHLACKIKSHDKWILVDCTWDNGLEAAGFQVNKNWDGIKDTKLAVNAKREIITYNVEDRNKFVSEMRKNYTLHDNKALFRFLYEFNIWIEEVRGAGYRCQVLGERLT